MEVKMGKRAQEEMIGFALIVIIVAVILLVLISFVIKKDSADLINSYKAESFIQASLQYTTDCQSYVKYFTVQDLILECYSEKDCIDGTNTCDMLNSTLDEIVQESWNVGSDMPIKGYELQILIGEEEFLSITSGNSTKSSKGASQIFPSGKIYFKIYY